MARSVPISLVRFDGDPQGIDDAKDDDPGQNADQQKRDTIDRFDTHFMKETSSLQTVRSSFCPDQSCPVMVQISQRGRVVFENFASARWRVSRSFSMVS